MKQMQVQKGEQAHVQCTALGDTPIEIMWKIGGKRIGEDMDQRCSFIIHIGVVVGHTLRKEYYLRRVFEDGGAK
jgi:hypothetical protein